MATETTRLGIADAAIRLGISVDTVRRKLKRGQIQGHRDNEGKWWIDVPAHADAPLPMQRAAYVPTQDASTLLLEELRSQLNEMRKAVDAAYAREKAERERHEAEVARLEGMIAYATRPWWRRIAG